jgi:hypothetical protein
VLRKRSFDARNEVSAICVVIRVLELASAAFRKMTAGRLLMMRPRRERSVVEQGVARNSKRHMAPAYSHAVASRRNADD